MRNTEIRRLASTQMLIHRLLDALCLAAGLALALSSQYESSAQLASAAYALAVFAFFAEITGLYHNWRGAEFGAEYGAVLMA